VEVRADLAAGSKRLAAIHSPTVSVGSVSLSR
jgi:hypothetical protein